VAQGDVRFGGDGFDGVEGNVRQQDRVRRFEYRIIGWQWRLRVNYIEAGAREAILLQCFDQRRLIHHRPAGRIDQDGGRLHARELFASDAATGFGGQRQMQADDVAARQEFIERDLLDRHINFPQHVTFVAEHLAAKSVAEARHLQANRAAADNSQSLGE